MKLYFSPGSCALAANISFREAGVGFEPVKTDLRAKKTADGSDFLKINPKGYVPTLTLDDGTVLTENAAILQYIGDLKPSAALAPAAGTLERYRLQEWLAFVNSEIHKGFSPFFNPATGEPQKEYHRTILRKRLDYLQSVLDARSFLLGEQFTVADAYLYTVLRWSPLADIDLTKWPAVKRYFDRVESRPHVKDAVKADDAAR